MNTKHQCINKIWFSPKSLLQHFPRIWFYIDGVYFTKNSSQHKHYVHTAFTLVYPVSVFVYSTMFERAEHDEHFTSLFDSLWFSCFRFQIHIVMRDSIMIAKKFIKLPSKSFALNQYITNTMHNALMKLSVLTTFSVTWVKSNDTSHHVAVKYILPNFHLYIKKV